MYRKELDKACFEHNAAYPERKDLSKRTISRFWKIELKELREIADTIDIKGH